MKHKTLAALGFVLALIAFREAHTSWETWEQVAWGLAAGLGVTLGVNLTVSAAKRGE